MKEVLLSKDDVKQLCAKALDEWDVFAPIVNPYQDAQFVKIDRQKSEDLLGSLNLDYESLVLPVKVICFPQLECMFEFEGEKISETVESRRKKLFFGLRACDLKGFRFIDDFFKRNFEDIYYLNRSADKLLVLVGCTHPPRDCFCTSAKTGPFLPTPAELGEDREAEFDLQMVDIGDGYFVEIGSEKGAEFVESYKEFFSQASEVSGVRAKQAKRSAQEAVSLKVEFDKAIRNFCEDKIPDEIYEPIAQRCVYCGACLYVCPTCTCFNVFDERKDELGRRWRNWDACVLEGYTREASGHNPRDKKWARTARRYEHKLKYDYLTTGMSGCVGCGRCLASCPVHIGISQVIEETAKL